MKAISILSLMLIMPLVCFAGGPVGKTGSSVFINGRELTKQQMAAIAAAYHQAPPAGHYWYDSRSGAWGIEGRETMGFILPGYDFGPLSPKASNGNTNVFINGREINVVEATWLQRALGAVYPGRWWLDGNTGYYGMEGNTMPIGNIKAVIQAQHGKKGDNFWCSRTACGNDDGHSGYVDVGGTIVGYDH